MPTIRIFGPDVKTVFVSIEQKRLVLADVRKSLPELKKELSKKWQVQGVDIEARHARARNPISAPADLIAPACVGIVVYVISHALKGAGTKIGEKVGAVIGDELASRVRDWLKKFERPKELETHVSGLTAEQIEVVGQFNDYASDYPKLNFHVVAKKALGPKPFPNTPNGRKFRAECKKAFDLERGA